MPGSLFSGSSFGAPHHLASPHPASPHLTSPHLAPPRLTSPPFTSPRLASPQHIDIYQARAFGAAALAGLAIVMAPPQASPIRRPADPPRRRQWTPPKLQNNCFYLGGIYGSPIDRTPFGNLQTQTRAETDARQAPSAASATRSARALPSSADLAGPPDPCAQESSGSGRNLGGR